MRIKDMIFNKKLLRSLTNVWITVSRFCIFTLWLKGLERKVASPLGGIHAGPLYPDRTGIRTCWFEEVSKPEYPKRLRLAFTVNGNRQILVYVSSKQIIIAREYCKVIAVFLANIKVLTFTNIRRTVSSKRGEIKVMWSLLPFAVNASLNLSNYNADSPSVRLQISLFFSRFSVSLSVSPVPLVIVTLVPDPLYYDSISGQKTRQNTHCFAV